MKLLIDANILLDVLQDRGPFVEASSTVWKLCETTEEGYVSALTIANLIYVMRKELNPERIEGILDSLGLIFRFTDLAQSDLARAAALRWPDFDDAVQSIIADRIGADYIVTRNVQDFVGSKIKAITPAGLVAKMRDSQA